MCSNKNVESEVLPAELFGAIVDSSANPIVVFDRGGELRFANRSANECFGQQKSIFQLIEAESVQELIQCQLQATASSKPAAATELPFKHELAIRIGKTKDSSEHQLCHFEMSWKQIDQRHDYFVAIFRNIDSQKRHQEKLYRQAVTDFLSGLANRRQFRAVLESKINTDVCLAIIDVDHFKQVNDQHGHLHGDQAIRFVAQQLMTSFDDALCVSRLGGDEFGVLIQSTESAAAYKRFELLRKQIEDLSAKKGVQPLTVSIGLAKSCDGWQWNNLMASADKALYAAKAEGRNRVEICE